MRGRTQSRPTVASDAELGSLRTEAAVFPAPDRSRLRVLAAIGGLGTGGSEKQLTELLVRLPRESFDLVVVTASGQQQTRHGQRLLQAGVSIVTISPRRSQSSLRRWVSLTRQYDRVVSSTRPAVVYAWLDEAAAFLAPICRLHGIPCVVARRNVSGSNTERNSRLLGRGMRRAESLATLVTANSAAVATECVARGHAPARVRIVPQGHEPMPPLPVAPAPPVTFGYVAQLRAEKGHHRLLDVLERMPPGAWRVDLAGDGPLWDEIEERVMRAGLRDRVRLLGQVCDVRAFWQERHVAMLLSDSEGMPNALLEAAFAGRPAIATDAGGSSEVAGRGAILVPLDDPSATIGAMQALIADPVRRERMGAAAWQFATTRYSMELMVQAHVAAITEALAGARGLSRV